MNIDNSYNKNKHNSNKNNNGIKRKTILDNCYNRAELFFKRVYLWKLLYFCSYFDWNFV